jgi:phosphate-selective porin OprO/OprP
MLDLLKILRDKGTISAQDYELLVNASKADEEVVADAVNRVAKVEKNTKKLEEAFLG